MFRLHYNLLTKGGDDSEKAIRKNQAEVSAGS